MQGTCNADQMEHKQRRKTASLRLIDPEFSVNDEDTKSKIKNDQALTMSEQGKTIVAKCRGLLGDVRNASV